MDTKAHKAITKIHKEWEIPEFKSINFTKKKHEYVVCVFVIDEGKKVQKQIQNMQKYVDQIDIVIADGGSTDGSLEHAFLKKYKVRALLEKTGKGKLSAQMRMALAWALHEGYKGVVVIDGNGKDDVSAIPGFIKLFNEGYDHIQGSRFIPGGKAVNTPLSRLVGLKILHAPLLSILSRKRHTDTTNGFRGYSAQLLLDEDIAPFRDIFQTYELHYHLTVQSSRKGYKVTETPATRTYPKGKTPTKISPVKGNAQIIRILYKTARGHYKKK